MTLDANSIRPNSRRQPEGKLIRRHAEPGQEYEQPKATELTCALISRRWYTSWRQQRDYGRSCRGQTRCKGCRSNSDAPFLYAPDGCTSADTSFSQPRPHRYQPIDIHHRLACGSARRETQIWLMLAPFCASSVTATVHNAELSQPISKQTLRVTKTSIAITPI